MSLASAAPELDTPALDAAAPDIDTASAAGSDLRERKRRATTAALAGAAFDLARRHGLDGFTVDDVARAAGVSRRTFFNHFASKEEAVSEVVHVRVKSLLEDVDMRPDGQGGGRRALDTVVRRLVAPTQVADFRDLIQLAEAHPALLPHLACIPKDAADLIAAKLQDPGPGRPELSVVLAYALPGAVMAAIGAVYTGGIVLRELDGDVPGAIAVDDLVDELLSVMPGGAAGEPAR